MVTTYIDNIANSLEIATPSPLQALSVRVNKSPVTLWCKRDDLLHPVISGNKWRKLQIILANSVTNNIQHMGSFGGAYSNHLHAMAYACYRLNIAFTAFVRAHPESPLTPTLADIIRWGTNIEYLSREDYRKREHELWLKDICTTHSIDTLVPEGGSHRDSMAGVATIMTELATQASLPFDNIILPVASGGTMAGLIQHVKRHKLPTRIIGIAVLKGEGYLEDKVQTLLEQSNDVGTTASAGNWKILHRANFHCGGYAKSSIQQKSFQSQFFLEHQIALDTVYNTKAFFAAHQLLESGELKKQQRNLIVHTGGMQGERT
ncbi:pyridoxal-phosphate dependent enzyme [Glaciecola sp. XM2]|uniref:1-aminocyclopropane-1-carboxylate deaminase/D-cysteine desulfhydrase n=1 Tax=Glaciecola sp. XM2 TaxID=1914931 RepID=UPI001BDF52D6|nr:pyridoxal-phosphate dependent enzyme [Glaciecola sp. XM2]MBT1450423.1 pyridoxal-phosphate dependent enzyme [Glaciecola sp. XM2]